MKAPSPETSPPSSGELSPATPVVFLHLQKTGGTSIHRLLQRHFPPECFAPKGMNGHILLDRARDEGVRVISGHLTAFDVVNRLGLAPEQVFTVLRDPVERALSHFYFVKSYTPDFLAKHDNPVAMRINRLSLNELLEDEISDRWIRDFYTKRLDPGFFEGPAAAEPDLGRATAFLEACGAVGVMPALPAFSREFFRQIGIPEPEEMPAENRREDLPLLPGFRRVAEEPLTPPQVERLRELTGSDMEIYRCAYKLALVEP